LHRIEQQLAGLSEVEPSEAFLESVMNRIAQREPHPVMSSPRYSPEVFRMFLIVLGSLILAAASVVPSSGGSWVGGLWPSIGLFRTPLLLAYLAAHPFWAVLLAGVAALLVVTGLALPEGPHAKKLV